MDCADPRRGPTHYARIGLGVSNELLKSMEGRKSSTPPGRFWKSVPVEAGARPCRPRRKAVSGRTEIADRRRGRAEAEGWRNSARGGGRVKIVPPVGVHVLVTVLLEQLASLRALRFFVVVFDGHRPEAVPIEREPAQSIKLGAFDV